MGKTQAYRGPKKGAPPRAAAQKDFAQPQSAKRAEQKNSPAAHSTKDRLLEAAIKIFALHGFEGAGTRLITREAGANISAIPYYFGGKEGLYASVLAHIASLVQSDLSARAEEARAALEDETLSPEEAQKILRGMIAHFVRFLLSEKISGPIVRIFLREQAEPTASFDVFYERTMRPMHELLTRLVARACALPFPSERATLAAHTLIGQIIAFKTHREAALRRLGWKSYGEAEIEKISQTILLHTDFIAESYRRKDPRQKDPRQKERSAP